MLEVKEVYRGKFIYAVDKDKKKYVDWRNEYYNKIGVIAVYEDNLLNKGKYIIRFVPINNNGEIDDSNGCLKTSFGDIFLDYVTNRICLVTGNSTYYFEDVVFKKLREKSI